MSTITEIFAPKRRCLVSTVQDLSIIRGVFYKRLMCIISITLQGTEGFVVYRRLSTVCGVDYTRFPLYFPVHFGYPKYIQKISKRCTKDIKWT